MSSEKQFQRKLPPSEPGVRVLQSRKSVLRHISAGRNLAERHKSKILRFAGLSSARVVGTLTSGVSLILLARWQGPLEFGIFSAAWAIILTASGVFSLGLPVFALRSAILGQKETTGYALFLNLVATSIGALVGFGIALAVGQLDILLLAALTITVAIEKNNEVRIGLGTEFGRAKLVNWSLTIRGIIVLLVQVCGYFLGIPSVVAYVLGRLLAMSSIAIILTINIRGWQLTFRRPRDGSLSILPPLAVQKCITSLRSFDVPIVTLAAGPIAAGLFSAARKVSQPVQILSDSLRTVFLGTIARGDMHHAKKGANATLILAIIMTIMLAIIGIWTLPIVTVVFGEEYALAAGALRFSLLAIPALIATSPISTILQDKGFAGWVAKGIIVNRIIGFAGLFIGALFGGSTGAMLATTISLWGWTLVLYFKVQSIDDQQFGSVPETYNVVESGPNKSTPPRSDQLVKDLLFSKQKENESNVDNGLARSTELECNNYLVMN